MLAKIFEWWNSPATPAGFIYPLVLMAFISLTSSIPATEQPTDLLVPTLLAWVPPSLQNTLHVPVYALLAMLIGRALRLWTLPVTIAGILALAAATTFGILDEWHQLSVPGRFATATDVLLNTAGAAIGVWLNRRLTKPNDFRHS